MPLWQAKRGLIKKNNAGTKLELPPASVSLSQPSNVPTCVLFASATSFFLTDVLSHFLPTMLVLSSFWDFKSRVIALKAERPRPDWLLLNGALVEEEPQSSTANYTVGPAGSDTVPHSSYQ